jgi:ribosome-binding ATPase
LLNKIQPHLNAGKPANTLKLSHEEKAISKTFFLLTDKPTLYAANVLDSELATAEANPFVRQVRDYARNHHDCETVVVCAQIESDLVDLSPEEAAEFLKELGVQESGVGALIRGTYSLLGLRTFFTFNEKEVRAWTIHAGDTAPKAAGTIHTDFERGFVKAETVACVDLVHCGSAAAARDKGHYRMEGKDYVVRDGDVIHFRFHV